MQRFLAGPLSPSTQSHLTLPKTKDDTTIMCYAQSFKKKSVSFDCFQPKSHEKIEKHDFVGFCHSNGAN